MMGDIAAWVVVGLVAGSLAGALKRGMAPAGLLAVIAVGVIGALFGGWIWATLFGSGAPAFLGSALAAVAAALAMLAVAPRHKASRFRV